ncbi:hypothetical protein T03_10719 [Trichinella britovi]|uniref:Uncharacterized protein n=1 Tax=Trichinella britovi TaxID=45882 RepID=A0A0V1BKP8_TRIBR|nr:hypothetical protein T03_10719 [Trichinella britovi]
MRLSICRSCPSGPGRTSSPLVSFPAAQECPCQLAAEGITQQWPALAHGCSWLGPSSLCTVCTCVKMCARYHSSRASRKVSSFVPTTGQLRSARNRNP